MKQLNKKIVFKILLLLIGLVYIGIDYFFLINRNDITLISILLVLPFFSIVKTFYVKNAYFKWSQKELNNKEGLDSARSNANFAIQFLLAAIAISVAPKFESQREFTIVALLVFVIFLINSSSDMYPVARSREFLRRIYLKKNETHQK